MNWSMPCDLIMRNNEISCTFCKIFSKILMKKENLLVSRKKQAHNVLVEVCQKWCLFWQIDIPQILQNLNLEWFTVLKYLLVKQLACNEKDIPNCNSKQFCWFFTFRVIISFAASWYSRLSAIQVFSIDFHTLNVSSITEVRLLHSSLQQNILTLVISEISSFVERLSLEILGIKAAAFVQNLQ